jgi:hypothetical protein
VTVSSTPEKRTVAWAFALGVCALAAAAVAARGPATPDRATFSWPPRTLPPAQPTRAWLTPLLVARHEVRALAATVPCGAEPTLADASEPTVLLATARHATTANGLEVARLASTGATTIRVGDVELARVRTAASGRCSLRLRFDGPHWTIRFPDGSERRGTVRTAPRVFALVSELDLTRAPALRVTVEPHAQDTHATARQTAFRAIAAVLLAAVLALVLRPWRPWGSPARGRPSRPAAQDVVVLATIAVWWLIAPLQNDDGWVRARQTNSLASGGFSNYFDHWGANLPLATWYEWLQRPVLTGTDSLAVHRLPSVALLLATWFVARRCLSGLTGRGPSRNDAAWWVAASTFAIGVAAFGMTLRPEPVLSLLAVGALGCSMRYVRSSAPAWLLGATLLGCAAVTAHPVGVVALAPPLVCIPFAASRARRAGAVERLSLALVIPVGSAWTLLLAVLDSDVSWRAENTRLIQSDTGREGVLQELDRYERLDVWGASPLRRELVALLILAVAAGVAAAIGRRGLVARLPTASVAVGLLLLAAVPSKWIWHFGAFTGLAAIALGFEAHRLDREHARPATRWSAALAVVAASLWAASETHPWGPLDTARLNWGAIPYAPLTLIGAAVALLAHRSQERSPIRRPESFALVGAAAALLIATTAALAADTATARGWTTARQALGSIAGDASCGFADDLRIPVPSSLARLPAWSPTAGVRSLDRSPEGRRKGTAGERNGWYRLPTGRVGVFVRGDWRRGERLRVRWGKADGRHVRFLGSGLVDLQQAAVGPVAAEARFVADSAFPRRPVGADLLAFDVDHAPQASTAALSEPYTFRAGSVAALLRRPDVRPLASPYLYEALPCAGLPRLAYGVAEPPNLLIDRGEPSLTGSASPFRGVTDAFDVWRAPLETWESGRGSVYVWGTVSVYWALPDRRDALAPTTRRVIS